MWAASDVHKSHDHDNMATVRCPDKIHETYFFNGRKVIAYSQ